MLDTSTKKSLHIANRLHTFQKRKIKKQTREGKKPPIANSHKRKKIFRIFSYQEKKVVTKLVKDPKYKPRWYFKLWKLPQRPQNVKGPPITWKESLTDSVKAKKESRLKGADSSHGCILIEPGFSSPINSWFYRNFKKYFKGTKLTIANHWKKMLKIMCITIIDRTKRFNPK